VLVISVNLLLIVVVANKDLEVVKTLVRENPLVTNNLAGTRSSVG
jgi:hypothetical protein